MLIVVYATNPGTEDAYVAAEIWTEYLPAALASGRLLCKPEPMVFEGGLEKLQDAVNLHKKGVSAKKIVVKIDESAA